MNQLNENIHGKHTICITTINIHLIKVWYRPTCNPTLHEYLGVGAKHHAHQQEKHSEK